MQKIESIIEKKFLSEATIKRFVSINQNRLDFEIGPRGN